MNVSRGSRRTHLLTWILVSAVLMLAASGCSAVLSSQEATDEGSGVSGSSVGAPSMAPLRAEDVAQDPSKYADSTIAHGTSTQMNAYSSTPEADTSSQEQLLIRMASMRMRVDDVEATLTRVRDAVSDFKGQIDDLQVSSQTDEPIYREMSPGATSPDAQPLNAYVTVRVPSESLAEFTKRVATFGKVLRESASQSDVTQQHIDLTARLKNLRAEEVRYRQFLNEAKNVKEMLLVEKELSRVRGEIEAMQSQLDYLDKQIDYGTLTIELQEPEPVVRPAGTDWGFAAAITDGIRGAAATLRSMITVIIALAPVIVLVLLAAVVVSWLVRRRRRRTADASAHYVDEPTGTEPLDDASDSSQQAE